MSHKPISKNQLKGIRKSMMNEINDIEISVYLLDVEDPINLGSIFRLLDGLNITKLYLSEYSYSVYTKHADSVSITSMGLHRRFEVEMVSLEDFILNKKESSDIVGLDMTFESISYREYRPVKSNICLILGSEKIGIYKKYFESIEQFIHIPMTGKGQSLNVANALSIVIYYLKTNI